MTTKQKAPDSRVWRMALRTHEENLQLADSVERVAETIRRAMSVLPGLGRGAVFLNGTRGGIRLAARTEGPEAADLLAPEIELTGMARRALRERRVVQQGGVSAGLLWAAPLQAGGQIHGAVAAVGENEEVPAFLVHAGLALARETGRQRLEAPANGTAEPAAVERQLAVLDSIVREGPSDTVLRRITSAFAAVRGIGRVSLWTLRAEDGVYVEVTRSENGNGGRFPEPPDGVRRAEAVRGWAESLPRLGSFAWAPDGDAPRTRPVAGDMLVVPLTGHQAPHWLGFLLARLQAPLNDDAVMQELERWSALVRLALEAGAGRVPFLARLEEIHDERRQIADLHRLKSQFIAAVSHELRTPLTSISAYAETLRTLPESEPPETRERFLGVIHDESRRLARIVDDILDLATMDAGRVRLSCHRVDFVDMVRGALDVIHPIASRKGVTIVEPTNEPAMVHADPDLLKQLVMNLLDNAVKFTDEGGEIRVIVEREASAVRCIVEDDGPGIPSDELDAIFERFYQVDGTDAREHGGSGLGLAICRSIATWHDGRIWAESGAGKGARLVVSLPRTRAVSRSRAESPDVVTDVREEHRVPELIIEMIAEIVGAEAVSLMLLDEAEHELYIQAAIGVPDEAIRDARVALGERIAGHVAKTGETIEIPDLARDERFPMGSPDQYRTRSLLSVPVLLRDKAIGVINVTNKRSGAALSDYDRRLVQMLAQRVALVLQKLREYGDRRDAIERMENAIHSVIDVRRHYFSSRENHTQLVLEVCEELGVDDTEMTRIHYASILRDVGMVRLPEGVYRKPARLSRTDLEAVRRHPEEGAKSIRPIEFQADVFDVILSHHEEHDGSGYPRGLTGAGIPRGARILAVVDAYDALRTGRPYKKAVGAEAAIHELQTHAGSQFDGEIVSALVRVLERNHDVTPIRDQEPNDGSQSRPGGRS